MRGVGDALRMTFFLRVAGERPSGRWGAILALLAAAVLIPQVEPLWSLGLAGHLDLHALPGSMVHVSLILVAAIAAALVLGRAPDAPRLFMAGLMVSATLDVFALALDLAAGEELAQSRSQLGWFAPTWLALAIGVHAARQAPPRIRRLGAVVVSVVLLAWPLASTWRDRTLWSEPYDPAHAAQRAPGAASEAVFYRQPALLDRDLDAVKPGTKGVIDVFFIGIAGFGPQEVFRREVDAVADILAERFGAADHSIRLVNNSRTLMERPIASVTSLRAALARVAAAMEREEDVLVLFMTSHGSADHKFGLELWPMRFDELDPAVLRGLLDESGIRHRVVIVSACFSGGFVPALAGADTLVITAAATDRTSFGCSNEAYWTYFGRAYFDQSLRTTSSFVKAFESAKVMVAQRAAARGIRSLQPADLARCEHRHPPAGARGAAGKSPGARPLRAFVGRSRNGFYTEAKPTETTMTLLDPRDIATLLPAETSSFPAPIPTQFVSSDEFLPGPQTENQTRGRGAHQGARHASSRSTRA